MRVYHEIPVVMRDGIILYANLFCPDQSGIYPTLVCRLPYDKNQPKPETDLLRPESFVEAGYCVLLQDQRGTGTSDGLLTATGKNEFEDGYDTVEWVAAQPWSDGKVAMMGLSNHGFAQLAAASLRPPHLVAIAPWECQSWAPFNINWGGTATLVNKLNWVYNQSKRQLENMKLVAEEKEKIHQELEKYRDHLPEQLRYRPASEAPAANVPGFPLVHEYADTACCIGDYAYWKSVGRPIDFSRLDLPMFHLSGWCDFLKDATIDNYMAARDSGGTERMRENQFLILGPWNHGSAMPHRVGAFEFGEENSGANWHVRDRLLHWMNHFVMDEPLESFWEDPVHYFVMQKNEWRSAPCWPVPECEEQRLYLNSRGYANTSRGNGILQETTGNGMPDVYVHDPDHPVPTKPMEPGQKRLEDSPEILDYRDIEEREDVLVYSTPILSEGVTVAGPVRVRLYAISTAEDVDFMCRLADVFPDGSPYNVTEGAVRARYRNTVTPQAVREHGRIEEEKIRRGEMVEYEIFVGNTAWYFAPGHRIRLAVASSSFPRHDINPGTAAPIGTSREARMSAQCVYHDERYRSALILPVLP